MNAGDIAEDIQTLAEIMTSVTQRGPLIAENNPTTHRTHRTHRTPLVITGDFNAHTADEQDGTRHSLLPPRRGDNLPVNNMGQALLGLLRSINWTILTNRFQHGDTLYSCSVVYDDYNQTEQKACIDYFLIHDSHAKSISGEAILKDSGSEIGRSDHNLCLLDLTLDPNEAGAPTGHVDMLPFPPHTFYNVRDLTTRKNQLNNNDNSGTAAEEPTNNHIPPKQQAYQAALLSHLVDWQADIESIKRHPLPQDQRQLTMDLLYEQLTNNIKMSLELCQTTNTFPTQDTSSEATPL